MSDQALETRSAFAEHPDYRVGFEPCAKRVRVIASNTTIADTTRVQLLRETGHVPVYYFPREDLRMDLLERSGHTTFCPFKGTASYWHVTQGADRRENAVWSYETPFEEVAEIKDTMAFYWNKMDAWFEEDEEVFVHARDPKVRLDVLDSTRRVQVTLGGEVVADTTGARFLFETGLPVRYYIPRGDVRGGLLEPSGTVSACPYKGRAAYHSLRVGGAHYPDIVWYSPEPVEEAARIKDMLCFFNEKVDAISIDGEALPKPLTKWS